MTIEGSHPRPSTEAINDEEAAHQLCLPFFPMLIGILAVMNVASVVMVLME
jgi:hypothetical protein